ncbi:hypothetical protein F511_26201 [Dorcoceras hygrometricum]|uniref:Uncharacterized protein n=1 Tax=Dorcoceras hygrometricum TaxID=472368 RepID=A0A2Z7ARI6_9LAMI|nr:hypothetical protein F511_26201 [Dorcoceras hygrometricum]
MKRRRAEESADGLALMTSSVTSSYSADGLREQSQESAGSLYIQTQRFALALKIQQEEFALLTSRKIQSEATVDPVATQRFPDAVFERKQQQHPVVRFNESAVATHPVVGKSSRELQYPVAGNTDARKEEVAKRCIQSKNESAAKQLKTYEELSKLDVNC